MTIELDALIQCRQCDIDLTADRIVVPIARGSDLLAMEQVVCQELRCWHVDGRRRESLDGGSRRILKEFLMLVLVIERNVDSNGFLRKRDDCHCLVGSDVARVSDQPDRPKTPRQVRHQ